MALKKSSLNADPDPARCRFFHTLDLHQHAKHSSRKKTKSPRKKQGGRRRGQGRERHSAESRLTIISYIANSPGFLPGTVCNTQPLLPACGGKLCGGWPVGLISPGLSYKRQTSGGGEIVGSEGSVKEWCAESRGNTEPSWAVVLEQKYKMGTAGWKEVLKKAAWSSGTLNCLLSLTVTPHQAPMQRAGCLSKGAYTKLCKRL